nr:immunoglobulin heavy chain junction region [Macaca mulatta]
CARDPFSGYAYDTHRGAFVYW